MYVCHNSLSSCTILDNLKIADRFHLEYYCPQVPQTKTHKKVYFTSKKMAFTSKGGLKVFITGKW